MLSSSVIITVLGLLAVAVAQTTVNTGYGPVTGFTTAINKVNTHLLSASRTR